MVQLTRLERLENILRWLTEGPSAQFAQCGKKLLESMLCLNQFPGYDRGIRLQKLVGGRYDIWWIAGAENEQGFTIVVLWDFKERVANKVESAEEICTLGAEPAVMYRSITDALKAQEPYFEMMHANCMSGARVAGSLVFADSLNRPVDKRERILDTIKGLPVGSSIRISWCKGYLPSTAGSTWEISESTRCAVEALVQLCEAGEICFRQPERFKVLEFLSRREVSNSYTEVMFELCEGFDPDRFVTLVGSGIESVSMG